MAGRQGQSGRGHDRYDGRSAQAIRDEYGRVLRVRDDYRPARSPSPVRNSFRSRDSYGPNREVDSYDGRERRRSRSPYGQRDDRYRERPLSPRRREADEDAELEIPRREPQNVPDVQLILVDQLDRNFVSWVESEIRARNLKVEVMFLSPRLPVQAVIRRQILEGVHAVSQLDLRSQTSSKIPLQVFDRQGGANNVRFDEYQDLDPKIAAELVLRTKSNSAPVLVPAQTAYPGYVSGQAYQPPVPQPSYQQALPQQAYQPPPLQPAYQQPPSLPVYQQTSSQQAYQQPPAQAVPNLANLVGQLDNDTLQKLLGSLSATPQQNIPAVTANAGIDLAGLLGGLKPQPPQQNYAPAPDPYYNAAANQYGNGAPQQAQVPQQSAQQVQNIMAQLAKFRQ
jgi:nuclear polyadenylated RNA-binding protein 3